MTTVIVVPCFNEAGRWNPAYWAELRGASGISLLFVNDGSSDETGALIDKELDDGAAALHLPRNVGKAEAVRAGLLAALGGGVPPTHVGFLDADGAFPSREVLRLVTLADEIVGGGNDLDAVWSARVMMAGRQISRHPSRHYIGRVISTVLAPLHRYDVYDTQSGFKVFASSAALRRGLQEPFATRWFPDIELLQRWSTLEGRQMRIWEEPVVGWHDVDGSKVNRTQYVQLLKDMASLVRTRVRT